MVSRFPIYVLGIKTSFFLGLALDRHPKKGENEDEDEDSGKLQLQNYYVYLSTPCPLKECYKKKLG